MTKKVRKIFKKAPTLAPKLTLNHKWTVWRRPETKNLYAQEIATLQNLLLQSMWQDQSVDKITRIRLQHRIWNRSKRASISKAKNYCYYAGRGHSFDRSLYMARHTLRKFARFGVLPGLIKERAN